MVHTVPQGDLVMSGTLCQATSAVPAVTLQPRTQLRPALWRAAETLLLWHERIRSRRVLASLDDRMLRDVGIDQATARRESAMPFWR
jgi:uncharacterized protein YjiS (DUF1127 family)